MSVSSNSSSGKESGNDGLEQINKRVNQVFNEYLKEKEEDGEFATGYVEGTDVLETFLEDYKRAGGVGFSIRDSWRRSGLTSQPRLREFEPGKGLEDVNDRPSPNDDKSKSDVRAKSQSGHKNTGALETQCRILWQSKNGCLKVPNIGMPFIIQAYERRVCTFTCTRRVKKDPSETGEDEEVVAEAEANVADPSTDISQQETTDGSISRKRSKKNGKDESSKKKRVRKSMKKECKAVVDLKEIWIFAEYKPTYLEVSTDHAKRKVREKIISQLQTEMRSGKVKYLKRYYLRLPYPKVHSGHEIGLNNKLCKVNPFVITCIQNLVTEGITAIKNVQHHINRLVKVECAKNNRRYIFGLNYDNSYYPDEKTVRNHIYLAMNAQKAKADVKEESEEQGRPPSPRYVRLLGNTASNVRSELKEINNLTQKCEDVQLLTELLQQIENIRKQFQDKLDKIALLPREPMPSILTQDSHASPLDGLNEDANPVDDAEKLRMETDLEAAEVLQSLNLKSFTHRDGLTDSPAEFDNIPPIPDMFQQLANMMPQQYSTNQQLLTQSKQQEDSQRKHQLTQSQQQQDSKSQQRPQSQQQQLTQSQQLPHSQQQQQQLLTQSQQQLTLSQQQQLTQSQQQLTQSQQQLTQSQQQQQLTQSQQQLLTQSQQQLTQSQQQLTQSQQQQLLTQNLQEPQHSEEQHYQILTPYVDNSDPIAPPQVLQYMDTESNNDNESLLKGRRNVCLPHSSDVTISIGTQRKDVIPGLTINNIARNLTLGGRGPYRAPPT